MSSEAGSAFQKLKLASIFLEPTERLCEVSSEKMNNNIESGNPHVPALIVLDAP